MLSSIDLNDKDYDQFIDEAIAQIPLYSREWTNMNPSEPGITILENLSAFAALQQSEINEVTEQIKWKLLALAGFTPKKGEPATACLSCEGKKRDGIETVGEKVFAQNICYELPQGHHFLEASIRGIYVVYNQQVMDLSDLAGSIGIPGGIALFGEQPRNGEELYLLVSSLPLFPQELIFYADVKEIFERNAFGASDENPFAQLQWEILTQDGFEKTEVIDETHQFLVSGYIRLKVPKDSGKVRFLEEQQAYVIRARLMKAQYDIAPRVNRIQGLLTRVVQKDTRSVVICGNIEGELETEHYLMKDECLEVYIKEKDGKYHSYGRGQDSTNEYLRTYEYREPDPVRRSIITHNPRIDGEAQDNIMVICRDLAVMPYIRLGRLYGYDEQELELPPFERVLAEEFTIIVAYAAGSGEDLTYHMVAPDSTDEDEVKYSISERENVVIIHDCGIYEGAEILLGQYVCYQGNEGNVLADTQFISPLHPDIHFTSCAVAEKGHYGEDLEEVRKRFALDIQSPATIVTREDCERLLHQIPGLAIHKLNAVVLEERNEIHVVVKPYSLEPFPQLSDIYKRVICEYLEKRRMLTTRIVIEQPVYVPIAAYGMIYIKKHFDHCREDVEELLRQMLDGINSEHSFGETVCFHDIYHALEQLECVEEIYDFTLVSENPAASEVYGLDIRLAHNALYYPGDIVLELGMK